MPSAGEILRSERLKRNRSLSDIATETCISTRYLEAIEADDISQLPGEFFYKAFLRQYAKSLDLDQTTTSSIVSAAVPIEEPDPVPALSEAYMRSQTAEPRRWTPPTAVAVGLLLAVLAGGSALYAWWQKVQNKKEAATEQMAVLSPQAAQVHEPAGPPQPAPIAPETAGPQQERQRTEADRAETPPPAATDPGNIALQISATEPAWVSLSSEGKTVFIGTLQPEQTHQFAVNNAAKLLVGNAGAVQVQMDGKPLGDIGPRGQVRTVVFTPGNFQILQPKPKVPVSDAGSTSTTGVAIRPTPVDR